MTVKYQDFELGKKVRFLKDYWDPMFNSLPEMPSLPTPTKQGDTGVVTKVSGNIATITLDNGSGYVKIFRSTDGNVEHWEKDAFMEIID